MCTDLLFRAKTSPCSRSTTTNSQVTSSVTRRFSRIPTVPFDDFVTDVKALSVLVGVNPATVTKKVPSSNPELVESETWKKFFVAEDQCAEANLRLGLPFAQNGCFPEDSSDMFVNDTVCITDELVISDSTRDVLNLAVDELNSIITLDWKLADSIPYGPGVTQLQTGRSKHLVEKLTQEGYEWPNPEFIPNDYFEPELAWYLWEHCVNGAYTCDYITQVPKNATINRTIGITSFVPLAAQGVCGDYIRECLRKHGVDLDTLADTHRLMAYYGSFNGGLATIDFSMASDTISRGLVWALLNNGRSSDRCRQLYARLQGCRTWYYNIQNEEYVYQKFSAMGNKFTFELESLLFTCIARAITRYYHFHTPYCRKATSFGDDTIIYAPDSLLSMYKPLIIGIYAELGLTVNSEKSFFEGSFRESCGADYENGVYVRGFYLHARTVTLRDIVRCINHFTVYYGVALLWIMEHCPCIRKAFIDNRLDQVCYENWHFIDQLASLPVHAIGAIDTFIVVDHMSSRVLKTQGSLLLAYEDINPLKRFVKCGRKGFTVTYPFDGRVERKIRRDLVQKLNIASMRLILALQSTSSYRRLAQRWEAVVRMDRTYGPRAQLLAYADLYQCPMCDDTAPICWLTPVTIGTRVRFRDYNPAWPLTLPLKQQAWT